MHFALLSVFCIKGVRKILKYLVAVTDHLAEFAFILGIVFSFADSFENKKLKESAFIFSFLGFIFGSVAFGLKVYDPRGMNLKLIAFNRWLIIAIACMALTAFILTLISSLLKLKVNKD